MTLTIRLGRPGLARGGRPGAERRPACRHRAADRCAELLRRELGVAPSAAVRRAAYESNHALASPLTRGRAAAIVQLEAGEDAAAAAGAVDSALERLRRASAEAARVGDHGLRARALVALGTTLVHAVRGRDEEGAAVLHQAIAVAERAGDRGSGVVARRELGYIDVQAGRRERATSRLAGSSSGSSRSPPGRGCTSWSCARRST